MVNCKICNGGFENDVLFYKHLRSHSIKIADYHQKYLPKFDKLTNEQIFFKNKEQYLEQDFISKINLKNWIKTANVDDVKRYLIQYLTYRKNKKNLVYSPSQVELKSLNGPTILTYNKIFGDYYKLCEELGFKNKYQSFHILETKETLEPEVTIDSREQLPLTFDNSKVNALSFGDYLFKNNNFCIYFERKSLKDLISTVSKGFERFKKEIARAQAVNQHLIVVCEADLTTSLSFNYSPFYSKFTRMTPSHLFHGIRELIQEFPNLQFVFAKGRIEAKEIMQKIYSIGETYKVTDLQLAYESKFLNI